MGKEKLTNEQLNKRLIDVRKQKSELDERNKMIAELVEKERELDKHNFDVKYPMLARLLTGFKAMGKSIVGEMGKEDKPADKKKAKEVREHLKQMAENNKEPMNINPDNFWK